MRSLRTMTQPRTVISALSSPPGRRAESRLARGDLTGCPWHDVKAMLREVGLRPTRQRMALGWILFAKGDRHLTAEMLYEEASRAKVPVSLATVYNTLHQFTEVGLLRQVAVDGSKSYFDTNVIRSPSFFRRGRECPGRYSGHRGGRRQDADRPRRLRGGPRRRGGAAPAQGRAEARLELDSIGTVKPLVMCAMLRVTARR